MHKQLWIKLSGLVVVVLLTTACPSASLTGANQTFASLMLSEAELVGQRESIDELDYQAALDNLRASFLSNGDQAMRQAQKAESASNKASLYNVAARSYLKSGSDSSIALLSAVNSGRTACTEEVTKLLPVTCGYFEVVLHIGVINEQSERIRAIGAIAPRIASDALLPDAEAQRVVNAARVSLDQVDALVELRSNPGIRWSEVSTAFKFSHMRQEKIGFCNADTARQHARGASGDWKQSNKVVLGELDTRFDELRVSLGELHGTTPVCLLD